MPNIIEDLPIVAARENALTSRELKSEAINGRYYSYDRHKWESLGWLEWLVRKLFGCFLGSVQRTCLGYSWNAIEKMPNIPIDIKNHVEDLFLDSLYPTNPLSSHSGTISRIFCRAFREDGAINQIDVQQHPTDRSFGIFYNGELLYLAANSEYGQIDFYNSELMKVSTNNHDSLWNSDDNRIGGIKLGVDYTRLQSSMELYTGHDLLLAKVEENKEKVSLVFRHTTSNQILAVGNLSKPGINWKITLIDQGALNRNQITPLLLAWTILKYSQHYHFLNPADHQYVKNLPQTQFFHA